MNRQARAPRVIIVGAGIGGLVAAIECACRGLAVHVLERAPQPGGKLSAQRPGGRPVDAGPTVFTWREIVDETLARAGTRLDEHLTLHRPELLARHFWDDGSRLDLFADTERTAAAIAQWSGPAEAARYRAFADETAAMFATLEHTFMRRQRGSVASLTWQVALGAPGGLARIQPFATLWSALERRFTDPRLVQLFGRYATYCGSSPFLAPATLMLIAHVEARGIWIVEGGLHRLAQVLADVARQRGATVETGAEVTGIDRAAGRVSAVRTADGRHLAADAVIMNGDAAALADGRFGPAMRRAVGPADPQSRSLSAVTWHLLGTPGPAPLACHNVFFGRDSAREFDALFRGRSLPVDPTVYVYAPDRADPAGTAEGSAEPLMCLVNAPPDGDTTTPAATGARAREAMIARLAACGVTLDVAQGTEILTTPADFARRFPATGGALYGRATHGWRASFERPGSRTSVPGLYLSGGSAHPGAGVPMAALSGQLASATLCEDFGV